MGIVELQVQLWQIVIGVVALILGAGGINFFSNKAALNGFKLFATDKLNSIESKVDKITDRVDKHGEDIAVLKSKVKC